MSGCHRPHRRPCTRRRPLRSRAAAGRVAQSPLWIGLTTRKPQPLGWGGRTPKRWSRRARRLWPWALSSGLRTVSRRSSPVPGSSPTSTPASGSAGRSSRAKCRAAGFRPSSLAALTSLGCGFWCRIGRCATTAGWRRALPTPSARQRSVPGCTTRQRPLPRWNLLISSLTGARAAGRPGGSLRPAVRCTHFGTGRARGLWRLGRLSGGLTSSSSGRPASPCGSARAG